MGYLFVRNSEIGFCSVFRLVFGDDFLRSGKFTFAILNALKFGFSSCGNWRFTHWHCI